MSNPLEQPVLVKVETLAQCKRELLNNPNCLFFFFNSSVLPYFHFGELALSFAKVAMTERGFHCVYYDTQQLKLHKGKIPREVAMGVLFYYNYEYRAVNDTLDKDKFDETLDKLTKPNETPPVAKPKESVGGFMGHGHKGKDYRLDCCVIL